MSSYPQSNGGMREPGGASTGDGGQGGGGGGPLLVRATHDYIPANNDELHISAGDMITVCEQLDGGWWEGTLGCRTGWFPSNYVVVVDSAGGNGGIERPVGGGGGDQKPASLSSPPGSVGGVELVDEYRRMVVNDILESERRHVREMQDFYENVLKRIGSVLPSAEANLIQSNYPGVISSHTQHLLAPLEACALEPLAEQRIGRVFLSAAPQLEAVHKGYCGNHPRAVQVVERHRDKLASWWASLFGEEEQAGVLRLIVCLSAPFRRLEKYSILLQELERHVEQFHRDRGDIQRSVAYFRELEKSTTALRKQKEMELEVLSPGAIKDFEGPDVASLGQVLLLEMVFVGRERLPRYFVLFPNTILILAYDTSSNSLTYKGRVLVSGITVVPLSPSTPEEDSTNAIHGFEIAGPTIHTMEVSCSSRDSKQRWLRALGEQFRATRYPSFGSQPQQYFGSLSPPVQAWNITRLRPTPPFNPFLAEFLERGSLSNINSKTGNKSNNNRATTHSFSGGGIMSNSSGGGGLKTRSVVRGSAAVSNEEDFAVLSIVDGFCLRGNSSNHNNKDGSNKGVSLREEERRSETKIINSSTPNQTRSLPHLVQLLRDDIGVLHQRIGQLVNQLDGEARARQHHSS